MCSDIFYNNKYFMLFGFKKKYRKKYTNIFVDDCISNIYDIFTN